MESLTVFVYHATAHKSSIRLYVLINGEKQIIKCLYDPFCLVGPIEDKGGNSEKIKGFINDLDPETRDGVVVVKNKGCFFGADYTRSEYYKITSRFRSYIKPPSDTKKYEAGISSILQFQSRIGSPLFLSHFSMECIKTPGIWICRNINSIKILKPKHECIDCLYFDIETFIDETNSVEIFQISMRFVTTAGAENYVLSLKVKEEQGMFHETFDNIKESYTLINCISEKQLLEYFYRLIIKKKPVFLIGYNIYGFDLNHLYNCTVKNSLTQVSESGKVYRIKKTLEFFVDSDYDIVYTKKIATWGIDYALYIDSAISVDVFKVIRENYSLANYKLNSVAKHFLGNDICKTDMSYMEVNDCYIKGKNLPKVAWYCMVDSILVHKLFEKLHMFHILKSLCNLTYTDAVSILMGGVSKKIFNMFYIFLTEKNIILNYEDNKLIEEEFLGGRVFEPIIGYYKNVISLDFTSLYPSIIMAYNLCPFSFIKAEKIKYIDEEKYQTIKISDSQTYYFYKKEYIAGYTPTLIEKLLKKRKSVREKMALASGLEKIILDKEQWSLKILANSIYGVMACYKIKDSIGFLPIASSITYLGRESVLRAKNYIATLNKGQVFYGDTDSCYIVLGKQQTVSRCFEIGKEIENDFLKNKIFPSPMSLVFEKDVYEDFILLAKKKYIYTSQHKKGILSKGTLLVRRNDCLFIKNVYEAVVRKIFETGNYEDVKKCIFLESEKVKSAPADHFISTTSINLNTKTSTPQKMLYYRIRDRGETLPVHRIQYIVIGRNKLQYETLEYILKNNIDIDYEYYIDYLINPLRQIMNIVFSTKLSRKCILELIRGGEIKQKKITDFFKIY
uniref:DNA polymerase n=1 Tax=Dikerogammarus haemobaphes virus 1 TaxID=2704946 RepID=A0A6G9HEI6_9VIRU|nr:family B DNA polymerase [Dikerogammarus haemobaphes virus 1]